MLHDILESDIHLAHQLIEANLTDAQIVAALTHRSLDSVKAAQLVADLRCGKVVESDICLLEPDVRVRMTHRGSVSRAGVSRQASAPARRRSRRHSRNPAAIRGQKTPTARWIVSVLVVCLVVGVCALVVARHKISSAEGRQPLKVGAGSPSPVQGAATKSSALPP
jgi:hypothetical protein